MTTRKDIEKLSGYLPLVVLLLSMSVFFFWIPTEHLLYLHDSVYYLSGAESIASGKGYRCIFWEGEPPISLYPPLQSLYLSVWWKLDPDFNLNAPTLYIGTLLLWFATIILFYFILVEFSIPRWIASLTAILAGLNHTWYYIRLSFFADVFATFFAYAAILVTKRMHDNNIQSHSFILGVLLGLMYLTRTAAMGFIIGVLLILTYYYYKTRKIGPLLLFIIPVLLSISIWLSFPKGLSNYGDFFTDQLKRMSLRGDIIKHYGNNLLSFIAGAWFYDNIIYTFHRSQSSHGLFPLFIWTNIALPIKNGILFLFYLFGYVGIYMAFKSDFKKFILPILVYTGMIIIWPWECSYRYFLPIIPVMCAGIYKVVRAYEKNIRNIITIIIIALLFINIPINFKNCKEAYETIFLSDQIQQNYRDIINMAIWINNNVKPGVKVACSLNSPIYNLYKLTERKFVPMKSAIDRGEKFNHFDADFYICCAKGEHSDEIDINNMQLVYRTKNKMYRIYKKQ